MRRLLLVFVLLLGSLAVEGSIHSILAESKVQGRGIRAYLNGIISNYTEGGDPSAALFAVLKPNGAYRSWTAGPISDNNLLRVGSITKMFTAKEWFELHKHHVRHALHEHPSEYGFSPRHYQGSDVITYKQVLTMTSGILDFTLRINAYIENDTIVWVPPTYTVLGNVKLGWKDENLTFAPGTEFLYSNTNCELIGATVNRESELNVPALIKKRWRYIAPSVQIDDGSHPDSVWPQTSAYIPWLYPAALPGVSGTLIAKAEDLLRAFSVIAQDEFMHYRREWVDVPYSDLPGAGTQAGYKYGMFWQKYHVQGHAEGHDGDLIVRSIIIHHQSGNYFFFHFAQAIPNSQLLEYVNKLVALYL